MWRECRERENACVCSLCVCVFLLSMCVRESESMSGHWKWEVLGLLRQWEGERAQKWKQSEKSWEGREGEECSLLLERESRLVCYLSVVSYYGISLHYYINKPMPDYSWNIMFCEASAVCEPLPTCGWITESRIMNCKVLHVDNHYYYCTLWMCSVIAIVLIEILSIAHVRIMTTSQWICIDISTHHWVTHQKCSTHICGSCTQRATTHIVSTKRNG